MPQVAVDVNGHAETKIEIRCTSDLIDENENLVDFSYKTFHI